MLSRVYALRPYVNIVGHKDDIYEASILYMPYFRGRYYVITKMSETIRKDKDCFRKVIVCHFSESDVAIPQMVISETYFIKREGASLIDVVFDFNKRGDDLFKSEFKQSVQAMTFSMTHASFDGDDDDGRPGGNDGGTRGNSLNDLDDPDGGHLLP